MKRSALCLLLILLVGLTAFLAPVLFPGSDTSILNWGVAVTLIAALVILAFFFEFETAALGSKEIALVAMLGTISGAARIPFSAIPSFQPSTFFIICSGYVFGPLAGFMVGATTALVSNIFLGQGPWTLYQMLAWGLVGVSSSFLRVFRPSLVWLIPFGILWGFLYGWIMNSWYWISFAYPLNLKTFLAYQATSIWFDALHAFGNAVFLGIFGLKTMSILERFKVRLSWNMIKNRVK